MFAADSEMERLPRRKKYEPELVTHVADLVRAGSISVRKAASVYGIPRSTIHDRVTNKYDGRSKCGAKSVLTETEEARLAAWAVTMSQIGYGRTRKELVCTVKKILDEDGRKNPFKNNTPGKDWLKSFFQRHPELSVRTTLQLGKERALISPAKVQKWYDDLQRFIDTEVKDTSILKDPSRIYNADESGFSLCPKGSQVIGYKGAPVVYNFTNSDKTQLTVMACMSASGHFVPPMIVYPGKRFGYNPLDGFETAVLGRTDNGWMDSQLFCDWLTSVFIPAVDERQVKRPLLLLVDGHSTHITLQASDICLANGIVLYCLLEHASHVMQPLDLRLFSVLKESYKQSVRQWQVDNIGQMVTKRNFAPIFKRAWEKSTTTDVAVKGFRDAGLYPLNPDVVTQSIKLEPSKVFHQPPNPATSPSHATSPNPTTSPNPVTSHHPASLPSPAISSNHATSPKPATSLNLAASINPAIPPYPVASPSSVISPTPVTYPSPATTPSALTLPPATTPGQATSPMNDEMEGAHTSTVHTKPVSVAQASGHVPISPFSKYLQLPTASVVRQSSTKAKKCIQLPKAITGSAFREHLISKQRQKEKDEQEKQARKDERERKKRVRQEEMAKRQNERNVKKRKKESMKSRKRVLQMLKTIRGNVSDDSEDDSVETEAGKCYECSQPYENDFIRCEKCVRAFHITCTQDDLDGMLPFECKYC